MRRLSFSLLVLLFAAQGLAADKPKAKEWQTLDNCRYVDRPANDGDSFGLQCGRAKFVLRLYFVDAPEANLQYAERARQQSQHFGATIDDTLKVGTRARDVVRNALGGVFVVQTKRANAPGRSSEPRYYGLVQVSGRYLHEDLVAEGLARSKGMTTSLPNGEKSSSHVRKLRVLEDQAHAQRKGAWARSAK